MKTVGIRFKNNKRKLKLGDIMGARQIHLIINGDVQGVGYRYFARSVASKYNLTGYVKNLNDGTVEAVIEGEEDNVNKAIDELRQGPPGAYVTSVDMQWKAPTSFYNSFSIKF
ncbi:MAG: acylphosphatase [Armatimonadota bacterium]